jgi:glycosyltransferase involved in cell wall biosynthesis
VAYLLESIESILGQSVLPSEIIVVVDGPVSEGLAEAIEGCEKRSKLIKVVKLLRNVGVGAASNEGIKHCANELVAKMDADDIAAPNRIELQLGAFVKDPKLTLLGGQLAEFSGKVSNVVSYRKVPTVTKEIRRFARRRSPFNNQTVMFKKSVVVAVGGYPKLNRAEDYYLYSKLIAHKYKVGNLPDVLVFFRLDENALGRRKTWRHTKEVINARNEIRKLGISNIWDLALTTVGQIGVFVLPTFFMRWVYKLLRK